MKAENLELKVHIDSSELDILVKVTCENVYCPHNFAEFCNLKRITVGREGRCECCE